MKDRDQPMPPDVWELARNQVIEAARKFAGWDCSDCDDEVKDDQIALVAALDNLQSVEMVLKRAGYPGQKDGRLFYETT